MYYNQGTIVKIEDKNVNNFLKQIVNKLRLINKKYKIKDISKYFSDIELPLDIKNINLEELREKYIKLGVINK